MSDAVIDLRSDTVTRPGAEMRAVMAAAPVGDIQYDDDPSVNALEERVADLLGKEAGLWVPSGTMANQIALKVLTRPGDDVIVAREAHAVWHEAGGSAANAGVQLTEIGGHGIFTVADFAAALKPSGHPVQPATTLVEIENTHNRMSGRVFPQDEAAGICAAAAAHGVTSYLDGARLWNAAVATGVPVGALAAPFDLVMVSFSKGLGAPGGSLLAGGRDRIAAALRQRRMLGGAMRQVGFFAAAADYALSHNFDRLVDDHANARVLADLLSDSSRVRLLTPGPETNIVVFDLVDDRVPARALTTAAKDHGILINTLGERRVRLLTHHDVSRAQCETAARTIVKLIDELGGPRLAAASS